MNQQKKYKKRELHTDRYISTGNKTKTQQNHIPWRKILRKISVFLDLSIYKASPPLRSLCLHSQVLFSIHALFGSIRMICKVLFGGDGGGSVCFRSRRSEGALALLLRFWFGSCFFFFFSKLFRVLGGYGKWPHPLAFRSLLNRSILSQLHLCVCMCLCVCVPVSVSNDDGKWVRWGLTLWGSTTRFCSSNRTLYTSSTLKKVPCFVSMETHARPPIQCSYAFFFSFRSFSFILISCFVFLHLLPILDWIMLELVLNYWYGRFQAKKIKKDFYLFSFRLSDFSSYIRIFPVSAWSFRYIVIHFPSSVVGLGTLCGSLEYLGARYQPQVSTLCSWENGKINK